MQHYGSQCHSLDGVRYLAGLAGRGRQMIEGLKAGQHINNFQRLREFAEAGMSILPAYAFQNHFEFMSPVRATHLHTLSESGIERCECMHAPNNVTVRTPYSDEHINK